MEPASQPPRPVKRKSPTSFKNPSIHSPFIDGLCVGGLSILVITGFLIFVAWNPEVVSRLKPGQRGISATEPASEEVAETKSLVQADDSGIDNLLLMLWLTVLLNNPHFMSSYRLLYRSREQVMRYRWSSMYMPLFLLAAAGFVLVGQMEVLDPAGRASQLASWMLDLLGAVAALYLAWHYNGQAWGMTASFLYMAGIRVNQYERRCIRSAYWSLTAFHVVWALSLSPLAGRLNRLLGSPDGMRQMMDAVAVLSLLMIPVGIHGFWRVSGRTGKRIPACALLPWVAIYFWYGLIWFHDYALIFLQLSHSLQYLCFTSRVEVNLARRRSSGSGSKILGVSISVGLLYLVLLGSGWLVFELASFVPMTTPQEKMLQVGLGLLAVIVNIHHYFVDGAIWKISNPKVRQDLFAHLEPV